MQDKFLISSRDFLLLGPGLVIGQESFWSQWIQFCHTDLPLQWTPYTAWLESTVARTTIKAANCWNRGGEVYETFVHSLPTNVAFTGIGLTFGGARCRWRRIWNASLARRLIAVSVVSCVFTGLLGFHRQDEGFGGITKLSGPWSVIDNGMGSFSQDGAIVDTGLGSGVVWNVSKE